jgi:hypothetical protein
MGDQKPSRTSLYLKQAAAFYRKHAGTLSIFLGLLSLSTCMISMIRDWFGLAYLGLIAAFFSLWIGRDIRKRIAKSMESGQPSDVPEDQRRLFSPGSFLKNSYFSTTLIVVLMIAFGCVMAMIIFMQYLFK